MKILSFHDGHNASCCLLRDGEFVFAAQEERFSYTKNAGGVPERVIEHICAEYGDDFESVVGIGAHMGGHSWDRNYVLTAFSKADSFQGKVKQQLKQLPLIYDWYRAKSNRLRNANVKKVFGSREIEYIDHQLSL